MGLSRFTLANKMSSIIQYLKNGGNIKSDERLIGLPYKLRMNKSRIKDHHKSTDFRKSFKNVRAE